MITSCTKGSFSEEENASLSSSTPTLNHRSRAAQEVLQQQLTDDPTLASRMEAIEQFTSPYQQDLPAFKLLKNGILKYLWL